MAVIYVVRKDFTRTFLESSPNQVLLDDDVLASSPATKVI